MFSQRPSSPSTQSTSTVAVGRGEWHHDWEYTPPKKGTYIHEPTTHSTTRHVKPQIPKKGSEAEVLTSPVLNPCRPLGHQTTALRASTCASHLALCGSRQTKRSSSARVTSRHWAVGQRPRGQPHQPADLRVPARLFCGSPELVPWVRSTPGREAWTNRTASSGSSVGDFRSRSCRSKGFRSSLFDPPKDDQKQVEDESHQCRGTHRGRSVRYCAVEESETGCLVSLCPNRLEQALLEHHTPPPVGSCIC